MSETINCRNCVICNEKACYYYPGVHHIRFCINHFKLGMIKFRYKSINRNCCICNEVNCNYHYPNDNDWYYCSEHKNKDMISDNKNHINGKCIGANCKNLPLYSIINFSTLSKNFTPERCEKHKNKYDKLIVVDAIVEK